MSAIANHATCKQWNASMLALIYEEKWDQLTPFPCEESCPYHWSCISPPRLGEPPNHCPMEFIPTSEFTKEAEQAVYRMYGTLSSAKWYEVMYHWTSISLVRHLVRTGTLNGEQTGMIDLASRFFYRTEWRELLFDELSIPVNLPKSNGDTLLYDFLINCFVEYPFEEAREIGFDDDDENPDDDVHQPEVRDAFYFVGALLRYGADPLLPGKDGETSLSYVEGLRTFPICRPILLGILRQE